jgi:adenosylmethionine-8-amino-7-oxononanoate aminotransferase
VLAPLAARGDDFMFYTFGAHPASCAAALAVLDILERESLVERAAVRGAQLLARLREALAEHPHVAEVRGLGLLLGVELVRDRATLEPFPVEMRHAARGRGGLRNGVFFYPALGRRATCCASAAVHDRRRGDRSVCDALPRAIDAAVAG